MLNPCWATLVLWAFFVEMLYRFVLCMEVLQIYTMGIFTEIPYKFSIYDHLVVSFHFLSVRWLICVINRRLFFFNTGLSINNRDCDSRRFHNLFRTNLSIN